MDTFGDCLEDFDVQSSSATVVSIVLVLLVANDAACPFGSRELDGGPFGNPGDNLAGIKREDGWVRVHGVCVKNIRKVRGLEDGLREVRGERVFIGTTGKINRTSTPPRYRESQGHSYLVYLRAFAIGIETESVQRTMETDG